MALQREDGVPPAPWLSLVYGGVLLPVVGKTLVIMVASFFWSRWRPVTPLRARWLAQHAWVAVVGYEVFALGLRHGWWR